MEFFKSPPIITGADRARAIGDFALWLVSLGLTDEEANEFKWHENLHVRRVPTAIGMNGVASIFAWVDGGTIHARVLVPGGTDPAAIYQITNLDDPSPIDKQTKREARQQAFWNDKARHLRKK